VLVLALAAPLAGRAEAPRLQAAALQEQRPPEEVKAGLLLAFAKKTLWPEKILPKDAPLVLGVIGPAKLTLEFQKRLPGKSANGHALKLVFGNQVKDLVGSHLVFLSDPEDGTGPALAKEVLEQFAGTPTLTVGDLLGFANDGGILNFYTEPVNGVPRMRFEINPKAATKSGLNVTELIPLAPKVIK
jgi:hypothetical protein